MRSRSRIWTFELKDLASHFYHAFALARWQNESRNRNVLAWRWIEQRNRLHSDWYSPKEVCKVTGLYALKSINSDFKNVLEEEVFTKMVDTPAADVLRKIIGSGVSALSEADKIIWSRFLLAFAARSPEVIDEIAPALFERLLADSFSDLQIEGLSGEEILSLINKERPTLWRDDIKIQIRNLIDDQYQINRICQLNWFLVKDDHASVITSDRPVLSVPASKFYNGINLNHSPCVIVLPLTPKQLFVASDLRKTGLYKHFKTRRKFLHWCSAEAIRKCHTYAYTHDESPSELVKREFTAKAAANG
jgi:hypothetical protein